MSVWAEKRPPSQRYRRKQDCLAFNFQRHVLKIREHFFPFPWSHRLPSFLEISNSFFLFLLTQLDLDYDSLSFQKQNKIATILHPISPDICWSQKLVAGCIWAYTKIISILLRSTICTSPKDEYSIQCFLFEVVYRPGIGHKERQCSSCSQAGQMHGRSVTEETFGKHSHQQNSNICKQFRVNAAKPNISRETLLWLYSAHRELRNKTFQPTMSGGLTSIAGKQSLS